MFVLSLGKPVTPNALQGRIKQWEADLCCWLTVLEHLGFAFGEDVAFNVALILSETLLSSALA
jgi:hypothetical protein